MFEAGLWQGGFTNKNQEKSFHDAGSFLELALYITGNDLQVRHVKTFQNDLADYPIVEEVSQGALYLKSTIGSIQDKLQDFARTTRDEVTKGNEYKPYPETDPRYVEVTRFTESMKVSGRHPELLVLRVDKHHVNAQADLTINCAPLFGLENDANVPYELVGFPQNRRQSHWTSVVYNEETWKFCDDDIVRPVAFEDAEFVFPADYLIYRKK